MNVIELYRLTEWVNREVVGTDLPSQYAQLHALLEQNANEDNVAFEEEKNNLLATIENINLTSLTKDQVAFLDKIGIASALGNRGVKQIKDILYRNGFDIITANKKVLEITDRLNDGISKMNSVFEGLDGFISDDAEETGDKIHIRVAFHGDASISNIKNFRDWGTKWYFIGHGIALAHGEKPQDIEIIGASKGSVILDLLADHAVALTIATIVVGSLEVIATVLDLTETVTRIKHNKLKNEALTKGIEYFEEAAEAEKQSCIEKILASQVKDIKLKSKKDAAKINSLKKSITNIVNFIGAGGGVDVILPAQEIDSESDDQTQIIQDKFEKIRKVGENIRALENQIKLIESKNNEDETEESNEDEENNEDEDNSEE